MLKFKDWQEYYNEQARIKAPFSSPLAQQGLKVETLEIHEWSRVLPSSLADLWRLPSSCALVNEIYLARHDYIRRLQMFDLLPFDRTRFGWLEKEAHARALIDPLCFLGVTLANWDGENHVLLELEKAVHGDDGIVGGRLDYAVERRVLGKNGYYAFLFVLEAKSRSSAGAKE